MAMSDGKKHGRHCYQIGCECPERKIANAEYSKAQRANAKKRRLELAAATPTKLRLVSVPADRPLDAPQGAPVRPPAAPGVVTVESDRPLGRVGRAVLAEITAMPGVTARHPGLVALSISLAELIDGGDPDRSVQAAKEIKLLLAEMRPKVEASAAVQTPADLFLARLSAPI